MRFARLFHIIGRFLGEQHKLSERERIRKTAREMRERMGLPPLKALER